jgi:hypothetical protein
MTAGAQLGVRKLTQRALASWDSLGECSVMQCPHEVHHQSLSHVQEGH